ncbi:MAG: 4-hydroxybenzoate octaprenyltransferase [Cucumibacter sp.]
MQSDPSKSQGDGRVADAPQGNWVDRFAPDAFKPYFRMARFDRPIGYWLLFWPCAMSLALAAVAGKANFPTISVLWFLIGAIVMRGAGCVFNDIVDRNIDGLVARTRSRPFPSGQVSVGQAAAFMVVLGLVGLAVLLQFNGFTVWLGIASLGLVVIYPFMKRATWWPQLFLGLAFSWGALMGWASELGSLSLPAYLLYLGSIAWVIGYDTIYALQDREDDALIGVKSTARLFGRNARLAVTIFYTVAVVLWIAAALSASAGGLFLIASWFAPAILFWQVATLQPDDPANCLARFKSNTWVGLAFTASVWIEYYF